MTAPLVDASAQPAHFVGELDVDGLTAWWVLRSVDVTYDTLLGMLGVPRSVAGMPTFASGDALPPTRPLPPKRYVAPATPLSR